MVQKKRQRSSLVMGSLLALLLGVAAGFFVLAVPIRMLETVTTFTRLSSLMVQAEPPISPNDRTLLAVLAGILTAGLGWVLVDWLLFGRAGMRTLIREREDDFEDEDGDAFRPTDPLDLVTPPQPPADDWGAPVAGDARRPLSARTDIGDPPRPGIQPTAMPGMDQLLPPIDQLLPGANGISPQPFPQPTFAPPPFPQPDAGLDSFRPVPAAPVPDPFAAPAMPKPEPTPLFPSVNAGSAPTPTAPGPSAGVTWLPTPGVRADGSLPSVDGSPNMPADRPEPAHPASAPFPSVPSPVIDPQPDAQAVPPLAPLAAEPDPAVPLPVPEPFARDPFVPQPGGPASAPRPTAETTAFSAVNPPAASVPPLNLPDPAPFQPIPTAAVPPSFVVPAPGNAPVQPPASPQRELTPEPWRADIPVSPVPTAIPDPVRPAVTRSAPSDPGFDRARLEELLARLERGLERRRSAQIRTNAAAPVQPMPAAPAAPQVQGASFAPTPAPAPEPVSPTFSAQADPALLPRSEAAFGYSPREARVPAAFKAPEPVAPPPFPAVQTSTPAFPTPQPVMPTTAPVYDLPHIGAAPAYTLASVETDRQGKQDETVPAEIARDQLLDQPLHVTLELLRSKVRR